MHVIKNIVVPTGNIFVVEGEKGKLECLSIGDYGKNVNLNQHKRVDHTDLLPLSEKWVCTISSQYGCSMGCTFCDVPKCGVGVNATYTDIIDQIMTVRRHHPEIKKTDRFNIHYARMGEPTFNSAVLESAIEVRKMLPDFHVHPVVSTMMPRTNRHLKTFISQWCCIKNDVYHGEAGLQISVNSTDAIERTHMFNGNALEIGDISEIMRDMPSPMGRKYTLNFAVARYAIEAEKLARLFNPDRFICKLTPMHKTRAAIENGIETVGDYTEYYPYEQYEHDLNKAGFETLVFIASKEEDESRITCGNAVLSREE